MSAGKAVVFGGSGFLGSYVCDELSTRGYSVTIADIKPSPYLTDGQKHIPCDIMTPKDVAAAVDGADIVYNFAGLADLDESLERARDTLNLNIFGNLNILEACHDAGIKRFVYASSAYANSSKGSYYGISKFTSEKVLEEFAGQKQMDYTVIRYGSLYGGRADHHNGMYRLIRQALETGSIRLRGSGEEVREYIHAADAARLSVDIIEDTAFIGQYLLLTGVERLKHKDIVRMLQEILNDEVDVSFSDEPIMGHYEVTPYSFKPNLGKKLIANPFIDLGQGLLECVREVHGHLQKPE